MSAKRKSKATGEVVKKVESAIMSRKKAVTPVLFSPEKAMEVVSRDFGISIDNLETDLFGKGERSITVQWEHDGKMIVLRVYASKEIAEEGCIGCIEDYIHRGQIESEVDMNSQEMIFALLDICEMSGIQQWIEVAYREAIWEQAHEEEEDLEPLAELSLYKRMPLLALLSFTEEDERYGIIMAHGNPDPLKVPAAILRGFGGVEGFTDHPTMTTPEGFFIEPDNQEAEDLMDAMLEGTSGS